MKNVIKPPVTTIEKEGQPGKNEPDKGNLYVAYRNKAMIDADQPGNDHPGNCNDSVKRYRASGIITSDISYSGYRRPVTLSLEDEMMLYNEYY